MKSCIFDFKTFQNAFMKAIHVKHLTAEDYKREGDLLWRGFAENFTTENLIVAEMDFSDLYRCYKAQEKERVSEPGTPARGPPPPPPPPPVNGSMSAPPPPPPPSLSSEYSIF